MINRFILEILDEMGDNGVPDAHEAMYWLMNLLPKHYPKYSIDVDAEDINELLHWNTTPQSWDFWSDLEDDFNDHVGDWV